MRPFERRHHQFVKRWSFGILALGALLAGLQIFEIRPSCNQGSMILGKK